MLVPPSEDWQANIKLTTSGSGARKNRGHFKIDKVWLCKRTRCGVWSGPVRAVPAGECGGGHVGGQSGNHRVEAGDAWTYLWQIGYADGRARSSSMATMRGTGRTLPD